MKVTKTLVQQVQRDIDEHGLAVAISNVLWLAADQQLRDLGVKKISTVYRKGL